jgi:hypothetical protein
VRQPVWLRRDFHATFADPANKNDVRDGDVVDRPVVRGDSPAWEGVGRAAIKARQSAPAG